MRRTYRFNKSTGRVEETTPRQADRNPGVHVEKEFVTRQVEKFHPDAPRHTPEGYAAFNSKYEVQEFVKRNNGSEHSVRDWHIDK